MADKLQERKESKNGILLLGKIHLLSTCKLIMLTV